MPQKQFLRVGIAAILAALTAACVWVYMAGGPGALAELRRANARFVILGLSITAFCVFVRFLRWQFLLRTLGIRIPIRPSFSMYLASLAGMATPAYAGEVIRVVFMQKRFGVPYRRALVVLLFERLLDFATLALLGLAAADTWLLRQLMLIALLLCYAIGLGLGAVARAMDTPAMTLRELRKPSRLMPAVAMSVIAWAAAGLLIGVSAHAFGISIDVVTSLRIFATSTLLGGLSLMPAGTIFVGGAAIVQLQGAGLAIAQSVTTVSLMRMMSVGATFLVSGAFLALQIIYMKRRSPVSHHFDEISDKYVEQFSDHVWSRLLERKTGLMDDALGSQASMAGKGLDLGCGLGLQYFEMKRRGYDVTGLDTSRGLLRRARAAGASVVAASALELPFDDESFDFVYCVGSLHHLPGLEPQARALDEVRRVLRPGGRLLVHESNPWNPLFRFYMGYLFPMLKSIDEGTEHWIHPRKWKELDGFQLVSTEYFTFMPDFVPRTAMRVLTAFERRLERSRWKHHSAHYLAVLRKSLPMAAPGASGPMYEGFEPL